MKTLATSLLNKDEMNLNMDNSVQRTFLYERLLAELRGFGLEPDPRLSAPVTPWGAYIHLKEASLPGFINAYWFDDKDVHKPASGQRLEPKILLVAPGSRLSLQYHHRRQEHWRVLAGPVKIIVGEDGASVVETVFNMGDRVIIPCGYWHRIAGLNGWSVIAELWEHMDPENPSDEDDIVRVEDDFSRKTG